MSAPILRLALLCEVLLRHCGTAGMVIGVEASAERTLLLLLHSASFVQPSSTRSRWPHATCWSASPTCATGGTVSVHEARDNSRQAANRYRKVIDFIRQHPDDYDAAMLAQPSLSTGSIRSRQPERFAIARARRGRPLSYHRRPRLPRPR